MCEIWLTAEVFRTFQLLSDSSIKQISDFDITTTCKSKNGNSSTMTIHNVSTQNNSFLKVLKYVGSGLRLLDFLALILYTYLTFSVFWMCFSLTVEDVQQLTVYLDPLRFGPTIIHCHWHPQWHWSTILDLIIRTLLI